MRGSRRRRALAAPAGVPRRRRRPVRLLHARDAHLARPRCSQRRRTRPTRRSGPPSSGNLCRCTGYTRSWRPCRPRPRRCAGPEVRGGPLGLSPRAVTSSCAGRSWSTSARGRGMRGGSGIGSRDLDCDDLQTVDALEVPGVRRVQRQAVRRSRPPRSSRRRCVRWASAPPRSTQRRGDPPEGPRRRGVERQRVERCLRLLEMRLTHTALLIGSRHQRPDAQLCEGDR